MLTRLSNSRLNTRLFRGLLCIQLPITGHTQLPLRADVEGIRSVRFAVSDARCVRLLRGGHHSGKLGAASSDEGGNRSAIRF